MDDEDGEASNNDSWTIPEQLSYKETKLTDELKRFNSANQCAMDIYDNKDDSDDRLSNQVAYRGFKKNILAQTQENKVRKDTGGLVTSQNSIKDKKITEYAQYLGLQPAGKYKCSKCHPTMTFKSLSMLKQHEFICQAANSTSSLPGTSDQPSQSLSSSSSSSSSRSTSTRKLSKNNNFRITRKVYLCAACGTYFENWNLFLHMREIHKRHICLFCLGMFGQAERLSNHLTKKHSVTEFKFNSIDDFYEIFKGSCYLLCCDCEKVFSETDDFSEHYCAGNGNNNDNANLNANDGVAINIGTSANAGASVSASASASDNRVNTNVVQSSQPQQPISEQVCSMCRQANGKHLATCKLGQTYDKRHDTSLMHERLMSDNKRTLLPNPANKVAKKLLNAGKARFKTTDKALLSYQRKLADLYARKRSRIAQEEEENEDIQGDYEINYNKFSGKIDDKRIDSQKERQVVEIDVSKSPVHERTDRYTDTIMQVSRCSDDWDTDEDKHDDEEEDDDDDDDDDRVNSLDEPLDEMEQGELILDDGKEDSIESLPSPIRETSPCLQIASSPVREPSPVEQVPDVSDTTENVSGSTEEESIVKESAPPPVPIPIPVPVTTSTSITTSTPTATASVTRVNSTNRSLVIKICTNKNSQFSIATPNSNGTYTNNNDSVNDEEDNEDEAESPEEINKSGEIDSDKEVTDSDHASDSDSGKLTVALPNESHQPEEEPTVSPEPAQLHQEEETKETEDLAKPDEPYREITPMPSPVKEPVPESDGILLANSELPCIDLNVVGLLESMEIDDLLKRCIEAASPTCVYCNHARHIAINGKQLALHMLAEHRFQPQHPAIIIQYEQFINRVKKSLDEIESLYFNFDSYDSKRGTYDVPAQRTYECYLCRIYYTIHKDLYLHNRKMHQKTILVCIMCKSTFYNHSELLCHLCPGVYAAGVTIRYRCCLCNIESLPSAFRLMVHLRKRHHACDVCLESTGNQQKLSNHVWKHKLHHLCYRCGIAYRNKPDITKHLFWKHGTESVVCKKCLQKKWPHVYHFCIPPSEFICEECGAKFTRAVALKVHKRLHTGDAPYGCSECPERFISKKLLAKHEDTHKPQPEIPPAPPENTEMQVDVCEPNTDVASENLAEPKADAATTAVADDVPKVPKEPVRKVVDVYDLPPLNLSSDSDSDSEEDKKEEKEKEKQLDKCEDKSKNEEKDKEKNEDESKEIDETSRIETNEVPEEIQLSEVNDNRDEETDEVGKQEVVIMNGIWDNFKSYAASLGASDVLVTPEIDIKTSNDEILKNIAAEHDYWVVYEPPKDETIQESENAAKPEEVTESSTLTTNGESDKKKKSPKKKKQSGGSSSSSDSSSDSDSSSCSCGTNCSCSSSSSGSSSSSSSSSDSDSSASENSPRKQSAATRKDRRKERDARRKIKEDTAAEVQPENGIRSCDDAPIEPVPVTEVQENTAPVALPLRESDLETTETETDEDFYDEYPQQHANRLLAERRNQSMLQESSVVAPASADDSMAFGSSSSDVKNGTIESSIPDVNSLPSAPSVVKSIKPTAKRKIKTKRRKKLEGRESIRESIVRESGRGRGRGRPPGTTKAAMEALKLNIPKNILYHKKSISPPTFNTIDEFMYHTNYHQVNTDTSGIINSSAMSATSENENTSANDSKRSSKRKRIPKRFYGDSSDEEQQRQASTTTKWRKTDSIPYIPSITIKQNFGPPPSSVVEQKVYSTVPSVQEPVSVPPPSQPGLITQPAVVPQSVSVHTAVTAGTTDSDEPADTSSDSSASECESTVNQRATHPPLPLNNSGPTGPSNRPANVYCYCRCPYDEVSEMIACDGSNCHIEWFHFECVGIMVPPKGKWYCPDCLKKEGIPDNQFNQ